MTEILEIVGPILLITGVFFIAKARWCHSTQILKQLNSKPVDRTQPLKNFVVPGEIWKRADFQVKLGAALFLLGAVIMFMMLK